MRFSTIGAPPAPLRWRRSTLHSATEDGWRRAGATQTRLTARQHQDVSSDLAHVARLGATAELTVVFDELGKGEKIVRKRVKFEATGTPTKRFTIANKEVQGG